MQQICGPSLPVTSKTEVMEWRLWQMWWPREQIRLESGQFDKQWGASMTHLFIRLFNCYSSFSVVEILLTLRHREALNKHRESVWVAGVCVCTRLYFQVPGCWEGPAALNFNDVTDMLASRDKVWFFNNRHKTRLCKTMKDKYVYVLYENVCLGSAPDSNWPRTHLTWLSVAQQGIEKIWPNCKREDRSVFEIERMPDW